MKATRYYNTENYQDWLEVLRAMLLSTRMFKEDLILDKQAWRPLFDDGYTPYQAVQIDFGFPADAGMLSGIPVSIYWQSFIDTDNQEAS